MQLLWFSAFDLSVVFPGGEFLAYDRKRIQQIVGGIMGSIGDALLDALHAVERPGDFCVGGLRQVFTPTIDVEGEGRIALPLLPGQAERLVALANEAPYGRGEQTLVDREVRRTWQIDATRVRIGGRGWQETLAKLTAEAAEALGVNGSIEADFYKLLVYDPGSFFVGHRDTEKTPGMFATMVLVLPSIHRGGELLVRHLGREMVFDLSSEDPSEIGFAAFYADCVHEVRPVSAGYRLTLTFNLRFPDKKRGLKAPDYRSVEGRVAELLRGWTDAGDEPDKLILPLEHAYTPAELSFRALKGADAGVASVLINACGKADCALHLTLLSIEESGGAEYAGNGRRRGWRGGYENEDEEFEAGEVYDRVLSLSQWRDPDDSEVGFGDFPFTADELCPENAFEDLVPDEQHFREATGNEGASFDRTYRRAALVLWPQARRLAVLNRAGLQTTLPYLKGLTRRWEDGGGETQSALWREAHELSGLMLRYWQGPSWGTQDETNSSQMLDVQVRLSDTACIDASLSKLSAQGIYAAGDNEAIVRAAALLSRSRATELLVQIIRRNAPAHLCGCGDLLLRCAEAKPRPIGEPRDIATALIEVMPGDPARPTGLEAWQHSPPVKPAFVVDLLTACSRIDAGLAKRAIEYLLAWPKAYKPDDVLIKAALVFARRLECTGWPAIQRLRAASLEHLRRRIALPLEAPRNWARENQLKCQCADCHELAKFLINSDQEQWQFKAAQDRRSHLEQIVRRSSCDLDLVTLRHGSPHTLLATKNRASYERRARQRREDLEHAAALQK
jgi:hypothetical protein